MYGIDRLLVRQIRLLLQHRRGKHPYEEAGKHLRAICPLCGDSAQTLLALRQWEAGER